MALSVMVVVNLMHFVSTAHDTTGHSILKPDRWEGVVQVNL